jgi:aspartyl-tRNA synthetase
VGSSSLKRDHKCAQMSAELAGQEVCLAGWVNVVRDLGGLIFVELRDSTGKVQLIADPNKNKEIHKHFVDLKNEFVIAIKGTVAKRPEALPSLKAARDQSKFILSSLSCSIHVSHCLFNLTRATRLMKRCV